MNASSPTRRRFLSTLGAASALTAFPAILKGQQGRTPNSKLNIACIGVGGRGRAAVDGTKEENHVAFVDVDDARAARTYQAYPDVPRFRDYRRMFDQLGSSIDAVTISTPDHMHFPIAIAALQLGKHVFVEKPLTHTIWESRQIARLAAEKKVATQMGNQGHAGEGMRLLREWYQAGILGEIREIHSWTVGRFGHKASKDLITAKHFPWSPARSTGIFGWVWPQRVSMTRVMPRSIGVVFGTLGRVPSEIWDAT